MRKVVFKGNERIVAPAHGEATKKMKETEDLCLKVSGSLGENMSSYQAVSRPPKNRGQLTYRILR